MNIKSLVGYAQNVTLARFCMLLLGELVYEKDSAVRSKREAISLQFMPLIKTEGIDNS